MTQNLDLNKLIPQTLQNETLTSLVSNLFNRFLSEEDSVNINGRIGNQNNVDAEIMASTLDRELNALVPAIYTKTGTEESVFTFDNFLDRLEALNVETDTLKDWLTEQSFNFSLPISYDKFVNFSNYFWVGPQPLAGQFYTSLWNANFSNPEYYVISTDTRGAGNDWQKSNHWVHVDDLSSSSYDSSAAIRASRPIIEYDKKIQLNAYVDSDNFPSDSGIAIAQQKYKINQLPQFDLFRYDGTHAKCTSGIFYYVEDPDYNIDAILNKRLKLDGNNDFVFGLGHKDADGRLLYCKLDGIVTGFWLAADVVSPRYVVKSEDGIIDYPDTPSQDTESTGTWLIPSQFKYNICRESREEITFGQILSHLTSVLAAQTGFSGSAIGINNSRKLSPFNYGVGGTIKQFENNFALLISLLLNQDISPITIIDFAEQQYNLALSSVDQYLVKYFSEFIQNNKAPLIDITGDDAEDINNGSSDTDVLSLLADFEIKRGQDPILTQSFSDTTSGIVNWPATLPGLGLTQPVSPEIVFDIELNTNVLIHHDGHIAPIAGIDTVFDSNLVNTVVTRSDGTQSSGTVGVMFPNIPYAGQLNLNPVNMMLHIFDVRFDTLSAPLNANENDKWINRTTGDVFEFSNNSWNLIDKNSCWKRLATNYLRNSLLLAIEKKLYASVPGPFKPQGSTPPIEQEKITTINETVIESSKFHEKEFAKFASKYGYDMSASSYIANDAFSWNYSLSNINGPITGASWSAVYLEYFEQQQNLSDGKPTSISTDRPDLYPWKLFGYVDAPADWSKYIAAAPSSSVIVQPAKVISKDNLNELSGLITIDGIILSAGDRVLVTAQNDAAQNGIYIAKHGYWTRSTDSYIKYATLAISSGYEFAGTVWFMETVTDIDINVTPITFAQVRRWSEQMWIDIKSRNPNLKLCVNVHTDTLLPPYVSSSLYASSEALTNNIPSGAAEGYVFGNGSPVEMIWRKSLEYQYGLVRSYFRLNPLKFLSLFWGDTSVKAVTNNLRVDRNTLTPLSVSQFQLHGEKLHIINQLSEVEVLNRIQKPASYNSAEFEVVYCGNNSSYMKITGNGELAGYAEYKDDSVNSFPNITRGLPFSVGDKFTFIGANVTHTPASKKIFFGLGQWFTNLIRFNSVDESASFAINAYRNWEIKMAYRMGAMVRPDSFIAKFPQGQLPETAYNILIKKSQGVKSLWFSGLRVQLTQIGSTYLDENAQYVPSSDANDWTFRVENYMTQHPEIEYYAYDTSGNYQTFYSLNKSHSDTEWKLFTDILDVDTISLPINVKGLQNVINLIHGYAQRLLDLGWELGSNDTKNVDLVTGRNIDWQLEIERLIDNVYVGMLPGQAYVLNPSMDRLVLQTPTGLMGHYTQSNFIDVYSGQAVYDVIGARIPISQLSIIRSDEQCSTRSLTPIFGAHAFIDEYEHAVIFNSKFSTDKNSLYAFDAFIGFWTDTAYLSFIRNNETNKKPTFNGFFLTDNNVSRNITSSIDSMGSYYDSYKSFDEEHMSDHAMALLGYSPKNYFDKMELTKSAQFNFWKGMIQAKGTSISVDAFANFKEIKSFDIDEFWAYKIAEYGDSREKTFPEIKISVGDVTQKFSKFQFYDETDETYAALPGFIQIENGDDTRWCSVDDLGKGLLFDASQINETIKVSSTEFPHLIQLSNIYHIDDNISPTITGPGSAVIINCNTLQINSGAIGDEYTISGFTWINPSKLSPIKLFDYQAKTLIEEIGLWHPAIGIHAYEPLSIITSISNKDPAKYNSTTKVTDNQNYSILKPWASQEVGKVWWDVSNLGYLPYYDSTIYTTRGTRNSKWGQLAEWASIDIAEWTESTVHPSEYDALAASQEGNSEIESSLRYSGTAAYKKNYVRDRIIKIRPIAWSQSLTGAPEVHPNFGSKEYTVVYYNAGTLIADKGRCETAGLIEDLHFGGWDVINSKPVGEVLIGADLVYDISTTQYGISPVTISNTASNITSASGVVTSIVDNNIISSITISQTDNIGAYIGQISIKRKDYGANIEQYSIVISDGSGNQEEVALSEWYSRTDVSDLVKIIDFTKFGISLTITRTQTDGIISPYILASIIEKSIQDMFIREGIRCSTIVDLTETIYLNSTETTLEFIQAGGEYEWRVWEQPSQDQLNADLVSRPTWKPYLGDEVIIDASALVVTEMNNSSSILTLKTGIPIKRFTTSWGEWTEINDVKLIQLSNGITVNSFILDETVDTSRLNIYANGIKINASDYTVTSNSVTMNNIWTSGTILLVLYSGYIPTSNELAFDPDVEDDFSNQHHYKQDYQFTKESVRDVNGNITGYKYYFWVKEKTVSSKNDMTLQQAELLLQNGPSRYALLERMIKTSSTSAAFDSCSIAGLRTLVTKNNAYKLRFLRDFTLRDDPEEMKLKNTHAEWVLLRKNQMETIPQKLWNLIVDAISGINSYGYTVPSQSRIEYDNRNNSKSRYGFDDGQIFADTDLVKTSTINTLLNSDIHMDVNGIIYPLQISVLDYTDSDNWFSSPQVARETMQLIWDNASPQQINEIFFNLLEDALSENYEFSDMFKTSFIAVDIKNEITDATYTSVGSYITDGDVEPVINPSVTIDFEITADTKILTGTFANADTINVIITGSDSSSSAFVTTFVGNIWTADLSTMTFTPNIVYTATATATNASNTTGVSASVSDSYAPSVILPTITFDFDIDGLKLSGTYSNTDTIEVTLTDENGNGGTLPATLNNGTWYLTDMPEEVLLSVFEPNMQYTAIATATNSVGSTVITKYDSYYAEPEVPVAPDAPTLTITDFRITPNIIHLLMGNYTSTGTFTANISGTDGSNISYPVQIVNDTMWQVDLSSAVFADNTTYTATVTLTNETDSATASLTAINIVEVPPETVEYPKYWRLANFVVPGSYLEISEIGLYSGNSRQIPLAVSSSASPSYGAVEDLFDYSEGSRTHWPAATAGSSDFHIDCEFAEGMFIDSFALASYDTGDRWPTTLEVWYSMDNITWYTLGTFSPGAYPAVRSWGETIPLFSENL